MPRANTTSRQRPPKISTLGRSPKWQDGEDYSPRPIFNEAAIRDGTFNQKVGHSDSSKVKGPRDGAVFVPRRDGGSGSGAELDARIRARANSCSRHSLQTVLKTLVSHRLSGSSWNNYTINAGAPKTLRKQGFGTLPRQHLLNVSRRSALHSCQIDNGRATIADQCLRKPLCIECYVFCSSHIA